MATRDLICRHCDKAVAVPASTCPWCGEVIMVICAFCKQYTDDQGNLCQHCGEPLEPDTMDGVRQSVGLDASIAQIVADRERARLVVSGVVARYFSGFLFDDGRRRTVLADLFGTPPTPGREAAALLFGAVAYLVHEGYCALVPTADGKSLVWVEVRPWDGQVRSLEAALANRAGLRLTLREAVDQVVSDEMEFRFEVVKPPRIRTPGLPRQSVIQDLSARSATTAVVELGRRVELPAHQEMSACREMYGLLVDFVQAEPARARHVAAQIVDVLDWFARYEADPGLALTR